MLPQLTRYLIQFQQVYIPSIGTIRLVQEPATLDVASKLLHPPRFVNRYDENGWLSKHQLWYFGTQLHFDETETRNALEEAGKQLRKSIEREPFNWNGIGTFAYNNQKVEFEAQELAPILQPITAERVLRENVQHTVLVGDQVMQSDGTAESIEAEDSPRNWRWIFGWAAVILSLFFILFYLYQHNFNAADTGLQQKVTVQAPDASYVQ